MILVLPPEDVAKRPGSVGFPVPTREGAVVGETDNEVGPNQIR
jgi:hypothetical protein